MKFNLLYFGLCLAFLSDVSSWTVNLAEMRTFVSDNEKVEQNDNKEFLYDRLNNYKNSDNLNDISKYAKEFEYQGYKEKKVTNAILSGSRYLEGLSRALLEYRQILESCGDNLTETFNKTEQSQLPEAKENCNTATKNGKIVQRLSELALQTVNKLKDRNHNMDKDEESEENELLLQLAWFLDHLARLTGYVPNINDFNTTDTLPSPDEKATVIENGQDSSLELLETVENGHSMSKVPPKVIAHKKIVKRSIKPLTDVVKYYTKYQLWNGSNINSSDSNFDIDNELRIKTISKRSISRKKYDFLRYNKVIKNVTKMAYKIPHIDKLKKHVVKVIIMKRLKN